MAVPTTRQLNKQVFEIAVIRSGKHKKAVRLQELLRILQERPRVKELLDHYRCNNHTEQGIPGFNAAITASYTHIAPAGTPAVFHP